MAQTSAREQWAKDITDQIGLESESRAEAVLKKLKVAGIIQYYIRSEKMDALDRRGMDFIVCIDRFRGRPLQIKSSLERRNDFRREYPDIPCVAILRIQKEAEIAFLILIELGMSQDEAHLAVVRVWGNKLGCA